MKYKIHVPVDSYAFVEIEIEGAPEAVAEAYYEMLDAFSKVAQEKVEKEKLTKAPF
jgi:hypothetical protein